MFCVKKVYLTPVAGFVARAHQGAELLKRLASGSVDSDLMSKYTALAASYCLLRYVENARGLSFADTRYGVSVCEGGYTPADVISIGVCAPTLSRSFSRLAPVA